MLSKDILKSEYTLFSSNYSISETCKSVAFMVLYSWDIVVFGLMLESYFYGIKKYCPQLLICICIIYRIFKITKNALNEFAISFDLNCSIILFVISSNV